MVARGQQVEDPASGKRSDMAADAHLAGLGMDTDLYEVRAEAPCELALRRAHQLEMLTLQVVDGGRLRTRRRESDLDAAMRTGRLLSQLPTRLAEKTASDYRMGYWKASGPGRPHKWTPRTERHATSQIRTWFDATFQGSVVILDEIVAGAGRLDLLPQLAGGLQVIMELKMCGGSNSSGYAADGEYQLRHYLEQRGVNVGYLVVFDGRLEDFGRTVLDAAGEAASSVQTIPEVFIDVRPRWSKRTNAGKG